MPFRSPLGRAVAIVLVVILLLAIFQSNSEQDSLLPSLPLPQRKPSRHYASLDKRMALSEQSWQKSVSLRRKMESAHPDNPQIPLFPAQSLDQFGKYPYTLWDFFPPTWSCPHDIQRVGRLGDGGKWVCGMSLYEAVPVPASWSKSIPTGGQEGVVIYSFGINAESSFEAEMISRVPASRFWGYDFSVDGWGPQIPKEHRNRTFFGKFGLGAADEPHKKPQFFTMQSLMAANNHTYIDILKIDVEGSEYTAFDAVMDYVSDGWKGTGDAVLPIGQVMIEIHVGEDQPEVNFKRFSRWWERLEKMGMRPTWMEVNLMAVTIAHEKSDPRCTEYVWVNARDQKNLLWSA